ncbi:EcoAI/FtnUII family type I restriction enzme subunit R [Kitasatospora sp. NPDC088351]|uniref:EcoAI/FtnUII family type I restriction enzme subunit R n=1 Tax=Kitasatospora sp. NPDC088351 TaxID=3155180 RepID=UPI00341A2A35
MANDAYGMNEQETCQAFVLPALAEAGWQDDQIRSQYRINNGRIVATARRHAPGDPLIADYVLELSPDLPIGVVEAKRTRISAADGIQQAQRYARKLGLPFAYATNGQVIYEIDMQNPGMREIDRFPSPDELWARYQVGETVDTPLGAELIRAPYDRSLRNWDNSIKRPRYYQRIAVNRTLAAIARGQKRILLTLATGTGKTMVAFQVVAKLRNSRWTGDRKPRVLYLADRNLLIDQPKDEYFTPAFGEDVHKISGGKAVRGRKIFFALYQSLDNGGKSDEEALFKQYDHDYFDLVIVDECHRGSSREESKWRAILEHFSSAVQIGLTATPVSNKDADTYEYFGEPVYTYSLADGIGDGYLAPYRVRRVRLNVDMTGYQPAPGQLDKYGNEIPEKLYTPQQYERVMVILERTEAAAQYLTEYLRATDPMAKTIVFCENNDHAHRMRMALHNANADLVRQYPDYVFRIVDADGPHGKAKLDEFRKQDTEEPVIAVTSKLLTTGVDMPSVRNIVLLRRIISMPEFKQTIGRGTRLCLEAGKGSFDIIDFVEATVLFNDPDFDGPPLHVRRDTVDEQGHLLTPEPTETAGSEVEEEVAEPDPGYEEEEGGELPPESSATSGSIVDDPDRVDQIRAGGKRFVVNGVEVFKWGEAHFQLDSDGRTMKLITYRQWVHDRVLELNLEPGQLRAQWASARSRRVLVDALAKADIEVEELAAKLQNPDVDPVDLLLNAAWGLPLVSREERVVRVRREQREFFASFAPEAQQVLDAMLLKFVEYGSTELSAQTLQVPPFTGMGSVTELAARFGDAQKLHSAIDELGKHLFEVA